MTLAEAIRIGDLDDYAPHAPSATIATEDADICTQATCYACGHRGLEYRPFWSKRHHSYRGFAVCPCCNASQEF